MGWASYQEDNLDARGERNTRRKPKISTRIKVDDLKPPDKPFKSTPDPTAPDVPVVKTRFVTSEEIQQRIQREISRQENIRFTR